MLEKVNTKKLVREVADRQGCYQVDARSVLDHFSSVVAESLAAGKAVHLSGLGTFYPVQLRSGRCRQGLRARYRPAASLARRLAASGAVVEPSAAAQIFNLTYREREEAAANEQ